MAKVDNTRQKRESPVWWDRLKEILGYVFLPVTIIVKLVQRITMGEKETVKLNEEAEKDQRYRNEKRNEEKHCAAKHQEVKEDVKRIFGDQYKKSSIFLIPQASRTEDRYFALEVLTKDPKTNEKGVYTVYLDKEMRITSDPANKKIPADIRHKLEKIFGQTSPNKEKKTSENKNKEQSKSGEEKETKGEGEKTRNDPKVTEKEKQDMHLTELENGKEYYVLNDRVYILPTIPNGTRYEMGNEGLAILDEKTGAAEIIGDITGYGEMATEIGFDFNGKTYIAHIDAESQAVYIEGHIEDIGSSEYQSMLGVMAKNHLVLTPEPEAGFEFVSQQMQDENMRKNTFFMGNTLFQAEGEGKHAYAVYMPTGARGAVEATKEGMWQYAAEQNANAFHEHCLELCAKELSAKACIYIADDTNSLEASKVHEDDFIDMHNLVVESGSNKETLMDCKGVEAQTLQALLIATPDQEATRAYAYVTSKESDGSVTGYFATVRATEQEDRYVVVYQVTEDGNCVANAAGIKNGDTKDAIRRAIMNIDQTHIKIDGETYNPDKIIENMRMIEKEQNTVETTEADRDRARDEEEVETVKEGEEHSD